MVKRGSKKPKEVKELSEEKIKRFRKMSALNDQKLGCPPGWVLKF
jgi:hypothetical protein